MTNAAGSSPSAQVDVAPPTGGAGPDIRGIKKNTEPSGALRRTTVHHDPELVWVNGVRLGVEKFDSTGTRVSRKRKLEDQADLENALKEGAEHANEQAKKMRGEMYLAARCVTAHDVEFPESRICVPEPGGSKAHLGCYARGHTTHHVVVSAHFAGVFYCIGQLRQPGDDLLLFRHLRGLHLLNHFVDLQFQQIAAHQ